MSDDPARHDAPGDARRTRWPALALLALVLVVQGLLYLRWMHANGFLVRPLVAEAVQYRWCAIVASQALAREGLPGWIGEVYAEGSSRTLLFPAVAGLVAHARAGPVGPWDVALTMLLCSTVLALGSYRLARAVLAPSPSVAVAALVLCAPVVNAYQRDFFPTLAMAGCLTWALASLAHQARRPTRLGGLAFGAWAALAAMSKIIAPLYLAPAYALFLAGRVARDRAGAARHALAAAAVFLPVVAPWALANSGAFARYATTQLELDSRPEPLTAPLGRLGTWTYYPLALVNTGLGFALASVVLLVLIAALRASARRPAAPSQVPRLLVATLLGTWVLLTALVTASRSQYIVLWVPVLAVLCLHRLLALRRDALRRALCVLLALAAAWTLALTQRPLYADAEVVALGPIEVVGPTDTYLGRLHRAMGAVARPQAEPWPVEAYADRILARAGDEVPRLAASHLYLSGNVACEALLRDRLIQVVPLPRTDARALAERTDLLILDSSGASLDERLDGLTRLGVAYELLDRTEVLPGTEVALVAIRR